MEHRATSARVARTAAVGALVDALGDWSGGTGPLYRQLARALTAVVDRGELARGERLPSERALAREVAVSRGVAVAAYDELVAAGVVERRVGSGTFVGPSGAVLLPGGREGSALIGRLVDQGRTPTLIDLSISVLHDPAGLPEVEVASASLGSVAADSPWGLPDLRQRVAERLTAIGLASTADEVVITTGAQQGISIAAGSWLRPGDRVVVDDPTYPGALSAFAAAGAELVPVPVDAKGVVLAALDRALAQGPALVYLQSGPHSPTGVRLSAHRRAAVARLVVQHRVPLVEDVALHAVDWASGVPAAGRLPIAALAPGHPVAVVGSYSKRFWAGLRVGFVRAPAPVVQRLVRVKATHDLGSSAVSQAMALALLDHPAHQRSVDRRNRDLARRAALLHRLLAEQLPAWRCDLPDGGLSLWVRLPAPVATRFAEVAVRRGVAVATAEGLSAHPAQHRDRIRLTFALPSADLRTAVGRLVAAWAETAG